MNSPRRWAARSRSSARRPWTGRCAPPSRRRGRARPWSSPPPAPASTSSATSSTAARCSRRSSARFSTLREGRMAKKLAVDKVLFTTVVLLLSFGLVMVYSASAALARRAGGNTFLSPFLLKQAVAAGLGLALMICLMYLDYRHLRKPAVVYTLLGLEIALLAGVLFAPELNSTRRRIFVAGISVQPSELAKLALIPFLAYLIEKRQEQVNSGAFLFPAILFTSLLAGLILLEPDMGTALLLGATAFLLTFLAGLSWRYLVSALA